MIHNFKVGDIVKHSMYPDTIYIIDELESSRYCTIRSINAYKTHIIKHVDGQHNLKLFNSEDQNEIEWWNSNESITEHDEFKIGDIVEFKGQKWRIVSTHHHNRHDGRMFDRIVTQKSYGLERYFDVKPENFKFSSSGSNVGTLILKGVPEDQLKLANDKENENDIEWYNSQNESMKENEFEIGDIVRLKAVIAKYNRWKIIDINLYEKPKDVKLILYKLINDNDKRYSIWREGSKIELIEKKPEIEWYNSQNEKMITKFKKFESIHSDLDPYGEEEWNEGAAYMICLLHDNQESWGGKKDVGIRFAKSEIKRLGKEITGFLIYDDVNNILYTDRPDRIERSEEKSGISLRRMVMVNLSKNVEPKIRIVKSVEEVPDEN